MKKQFFMLALAGALAILSGCQTDNSQQQKAAQTNDSLQAEIARVEKIIFASEKSFDGNLALSLMRTYQEYYNANTEDTLSADYLLKAAELAMAVNRNGKSLELLTNLENAFPNFEKLPEVSNMIAFIYDEKLGDKTKAEKAYTYLIERFPDHRLAKDAEARLKTLHMTDEELLEHFQQLNGQ